MKQKGKNNLITLRSLSLEEAMEEIARYFRENDGREIMEYECIHSGALEVWAIYDGKKYSRDLVCSQKI